MEILLVQHDRGRSNARNPSILLIEDDREQAVEIEKALRLRFGNVDLKLIETVREFHDHLEAGRLKGFDVAVIDIMLPWDRVTRNARLAPTGFDYTSAGFLCRDRLRGGSFRSPVLFYSMTSKYDWRSRLKEGDEFLTKRAGHVELLEALTRVLVKPN